MLEDYAKKNGFTGIRHFTDDEISGTTFEREGFKPCFRSGKEQYRKPRAVSTEQRERARQMMIERKKAKED